jgi:hypothetical protein
VKKSVLTLEVSSVTRKSRQNFSNKAQIVKGVELLNPLLYFKGIIYMNKLILETLQTINLHYGRGDIESIDVGQGVATIKHGWVSSEQEKMVEKKKFTVKNDCVTFRGVTRKLGYKVR